MTSRWTSDDANEIITNPVYAGMGPIPPCIKEEVWLQANLEMMKVKGTRDTIASILARFQEVFPLLQAPDPEPYVQRADQDAEGALRHLLHDLRGLFD